MLVNDLIPEGTYVKVKADLRVDSRNSYGISVVEDMIRYRGHIFKVHSNRKHYIDDSSYVIYMDLIDPITGFINFWTWTPVMLEFPDNSEIASMKERKQHD